jgi:hypothetical protein
LRLEVKGEVEIKVEAGLTTPLVASPGPDIHDTPDRPLRVHLVRDLHSECAVTVIFMYSPIVTVPSVSSSTRHQTAA